MIFGTAGHVDHGKTALVRALTGVDTDRLPDERRRGISIELGFAPLELDDGQVVSIVDVPGHERFVDTMIAGASGIDAALLVVAATEGVMPQTEEHCAVLRALDVPIAAVIVTKIDRIPSDAVASRIARIRESVATCGVPDTVPIVPVAVPSGDGIGAVRAALEDAARHGEARDDDDLFRFIVDRAFSVRGTGTVVTGTVWSGGIAVGARVRVLPDGRTWRVRAVQTHGAPTSRAVAGARFALAVADASPDDIVRGATLVTDDAWSPSTRIVARLDSMRQRLGRQLAVHLCGARVNAHWTASATDAHVVRLALDRPLVARRGDRIVIRAGEGAREIVGATVLDPLPGRGATIADDAIDHLVAIARVAGTRGVARAELPIRLGIAPREAAAAVGAAALIDAAGRVYDPAVVEALAAQAVAHVARRATEHPFDHPFGTDELRALLRVQGPVLEAALARAEGEGRLRLADGRVAPAEAKLPSAAEARLARILEWVGAAGIEGATAEEAMSAFGASAEELLRHAERRGNLIHLAGVRYCDVSVVAAAIDRLRAAMSSGREFTPSELRGVLGVSRKYLIPLLEYCDAARVTIRRSGGRVLADVSSR